MPLRDNVHRLLNDHLTMHDGKPVKVTGLLHQLNAAVTEQTRAGSAGSGGKSLPIGEGALALLQDIEREAQDHQQEMLARGGRLRAIVASWAGPPTQAWEDFLEHVTLDWIDRITAIVSPTKPPRKIHQPCPACGVLYGGDDRKPGLHLHCWDSDGAMLPPGKWTCECVHCGAAWNGDDLGWLSRAVNSEMGVADTPSGERMTAV